MIVGGPDLADRSEVDGELHGAVDAEQLINELMVWGTRIFNNKPAALATVTA